MSPHDMYQQEIHHYVTEYLAAINQAAETLTGNDRTRSLMSAQAELLFHLNGGERCSKCTAHVRHVIRVTSLHQDGAAFDFPALCNRCLVAEEAIASQITFSLKPEYLNQLVEVLRMHRPARAVAA